MRCKLIVSGLLFLLAVSSVQAAVSLPRLLSDHMVLQRDAPVRLWGTASPGEMVKVTFRQESVSVKADASGKWEAFLSPMKAGGPDDMRIEGDNAITLRDVLVGEVWVASGQSNMQWTVGRSDNAEQEIAAANHPMIRLFMVELETAEAPKDDVTGSWARCSPESVPEFSAVAYYFGRYLHQELDVPIGLIRSAWGGTPAEAWTSMETLRADPALAYYLQKWDKVLADYPSEMARYQQAVKAWEERAAKAGGNPPAKPREPRGPGHQHQPATLYNAMIAPLTPLAIRGAIWYQGESNAGTEEAFLYRRLFQTMIADWRARWAIGNFPFLFVQLADFDAGALRDWPILRESQTDTLQLRNTGMAVTTDIGNAKNIHPTNKQDVGKRLALWALAETYGKNVVYSGPLYRQMTVEGNRARLWFDHAGGGLKAAGGVLKGFVIAGPDHIFHPAGAVIDGGNVVVSSPAVTEPKAVRYGWANVPENTLRNAEGLPASPFRTDRWNNARMPE